jgi:hypothetical protein
VITAQRTHGRTPLGRQFLEHGFVVSRDARGLAIATGRPAPHAFGDRTGVVGAGLCRRGGIAFATRFRIFNRANVQTRIDESKSTGPIRSKKLPRRWEPPGARSGDG